MLLFCVSLSSLTLITDGVGSLAAALPPILREASSSGSVLGAGGGVALQDRSEVAGTPATGSVGGGWARVGAGRGAAGRSACWGGILWGQTVWKTSEEGPCEMTGRSLSAHCGEQQGAAGTGVIVHARWGFSSQALWALGLHSLCSRWGPPRASEGAWQHPQPLPTARK